MLLEPIVTIEVTIPGEKFGDISADLSTRRGHITGMDSLSGNLQVIRAEIPLAEVLTYASQLKSMTGGQGSFTMDFKSHDPVPPNVQAADRRSVQEVARGDRGRVTRGGRLPQPRSRPRTLELRR